MGFEGTTGVYERIFRFFFCCCCCSYLSNDDIMSQGPGLKTGVQNDIFWSEMGEPGGTPPPRIPGSLYVSGKLPTYPSPKPTLTLTSHLRQSVGLGEG